MHRLSVVRKLRIGLLALACLCATATSLLAQASVIILVRHGEKTTGGSDPALSAAGQARAEALARVLGDAKVEAILVTEYRRTSETAAPFARLAGLTPQRVAAGGLGVPAHAAAVRQAIDALPAGSTVLVVGHSNTIPSIIAALGGPELPDLADDEFSTLFVLTRQVVGGSRLVRASYGVVPSAPPSR